MSWTFTFSMLMFLHVTVAIAPEPSNQMIKGFFPKDVGSKWVYRSTNKVDKKSYTYVEVISSIKEKKTEKIITVDRGDGEGGQFTPSEVWIISDKGQYLKECITEALTGARATKNPQLYLKLPHKHGQNWDLGNDSAPIVMKSFGPELVKAPIGEYKAIRVEEWDKLAPNLLATRWYAPDTGMIKYEDKHCIIELISFKTGSK